MKIVHISPGAGGMYCGMCIRESTLVAALRAAGHDVSLMPTYTPIRTDDVDVSENAIYFGGINVYLQQQSAVFRHTPWALDRLLNIRRLVRWATKTSTKTDPEFLGELTVSMLSGEQGRQRKELAKLLRALRDRVRPDLVVLTTALLAGMTRQIRKELSVPVLIGLQGEDLFLDQLPRHYRDRCLALLRERLAEADGFISISAYYATVAAEQFAVDSGRIDVVQSGINPDGHEPAAQAPHVFTVGYFARISREKGLHLLVDAFARLRMLAGSTRCKLRIGGWSGAAEQPYLHEVRRQIDAAGIADDCEFVGELNRIEKIRFFQSLSAFSVPTIYRDARGLVVLEAMATGVPVVQPRHGVFPELIEATGGGLLVNPNDPDDLAATLHRLMTDQPMRESLGAKGRDAVHERFTASAMARAMAAVYARFSRR